MRQEKLPSELTNMVRLSIDTLGGVIKKREGQAFFNEVEAIRKMMVEYRDLDIQGQKKILSKLFIKLKTKHKDKRVKLVHAYALMLELINCCETVFRHSRLQQQTYKIDERKEESVIMVLTAHPTEARSAEIIELYRHIKRVLQRWMQTQKRSLFDELAALLSFAWETPTTKHVRPTVKDEAQHVYTTVLREDLLVSLMELNASVRVRLRSWVGGDKDGHPGVDEKVMLQSLQCSRQLLLKRVSVWLKSYLNDTNIKKEPRLLTLCSKAMERSREMKKIIAGDAKRVAIFQKSLEKLIDAHIKRFGFRDPHLKKVADLLRLFPALVVPLELREDASVIEQALHSPRPLAIARMLKKIAQLAGPKQSRYYAQGLIISMTSRAQDLLNAQKLCSRYLKSSAIPIIPLFETADALRDSVEILKSALANKSYARQIKEYWRQRLEVMVGYSDSSKMMGVLAGRTFLAQAVVRLDSFIQSQGHTPIFFHGSGGSIDRGGGSIEEQTSWWPTSALQTYKATIQGEMVDRTFSSAMVFESFVQKIQKNYLAPGKKDLQLPREAENFISRVSVEYQKKLNDADFFSVLMKATPYAYLDVLKIGSRPSKRKQTQSFGQIRAIPWILCWTQTRVLFPTWWGIGTQWAQSNESVRKALKDSFEKNPVFSTFVKNLGFTLAKVELPIWHMYLSELLDNAKTVSYYEKLFTEEFKNTRDFFCFVTGQEDLLWFRPWLRESIRLRSSMIHPINMVQILAFKQKDEMMIRKTVAGVAAGMLTTG